MAVYVVDGGAVAWSQVVIGRVISCPEVHFVLHIPVREIVKKGKK
jgi:hypothetical protein